MTGGENSVLLVEDDETVAELEKRVLSRAGWSVHTVHRVNDAVALLREQNFRVIVLDYGLPDGEPWVVVEAANAKQPRIPVIMATAMGDEGVAAEALHRGISHYVKKAEGFWETIPEAVSRVARTAILEEQLHLGDALFHVIAGNLSDLIVVCDLRGNARYISPACRNVLGYEPQELHAALSLELVHPDDRARVSDLLANIVERGQSSLVYRCRAKGGSYRWIESNGNLLCDSDNREPVMIAISRDVTARKNAEAEIIKLNTTLELLLNGAKDYAIFMLDCEGKVATWNSGAERMKGFSAPEIVGRHFSVFYPAGAVRLKHPDEVLTIAAHEGRYEEEGWHIRKDGTPFWANAVITAIRDASGELRGFSDVTRDATELKKAAEALISARQRAEEANRAKSDFLAAMSHEIRTPMNAILGMSDLLKETGLSTVQRDYVDRCRRAGASLLALVNDILDLSKIESGRFELERVPFDLEDLVERTAEMIAPRANLKGVGLFASLAPETPRNVIGDPIRLQQILTNLFGNAVKFTDKGEVVLTVAPVGDGDPGHVRFELTDTGIGISTEKLEAVFEDFIQAESSTTRRFGGTGLGLGIARRLVRCMGGNLTVSSILGQGSTFTFDAMFSINQHPLPVATRPSHPMRGAADIAAKILIAEDCEDNRFLVEVYLKGQPYELKFVENGQEAIEAFEKEEFDLVLVDIQMPVMDGLKATEAMRALERQEARARTPILALTADALLGDAERSRAAGCDGHLSKPISKEQLITAIDNVRFVAHAGS